MPAPSASARRSAQASRVRMHGLPTRAPDKKGRGLGRLTAVVNGAATYGVSLFKSLLGQRRN